VLPLLVSLSHSNSRFGVERCVGVSRGAESSEKEMKMKTTFSVREIANFKREARDRKRSSGLKLNMELDSIAQEQGFSNWSLMMKTTAHEKAEPSNDQREPITRDALLRICLQYILELDGKSIRKLCWSGSLWVDKSDVFSGTVTLDSLHTLGVCWDSITRQCAREIGAVLLTSFEGVADQFVDDEDEDGNKLKPARGQTTYTTEAGRSALMEVFQTGFDGDFDGLMVDLENTADAYD
jgi:hypothetical protein